MLTRLKEQDFFQKHEAILKRAKSLGFTHLWVMLPSISRLNPLDPEMLHLMFLLEPSKSKYRIKQENMFSDALLDEFDIKVILELYDKEAFEEWIAISPKDEKLYRARLHHIIPIENLLPDTPLTEQTVHPLIPPSLEELRKRVFSKAEKSKEEINSHEFVASNDTSTSTTSTLANIASADNTTVDHSPTNITLPLISSTDAPSEKNKHLLREEELVEPSYKMPKVSHEETTPPQRQRPVIIFNGAKFFHKKTKGGDLLKFNRKNNTRKLP